MSMARDDFLHLEDIQGAIETIEGYVEGIDKADFNAHQMVQDSVMRQLEIIGETTNHLSHQIRQENPQIPWAQMAGMRNRLIHGYFAVELEKAHN